MCFLRLLWCRIATGANRPHRFVRDHCFLQFLWRETGEAAAQLKRQNFFNVSCVALLEGFANANNRPQRCLMRGAYFAVHSFVSFAKQSAAFAVPKHDIVDKQISQERTADLAGKSAAFFPIHVLRTHFDVLRSTKRFHDFRDCGERRHDYHFHTGDFAAVPKKRFYETLGLPLSHVHLPIRSDDFFAHQVLSVNAATPGSSLPSSNSSDAPPPMIVVAPDCAIASAIAIVPSPNSGISNTPIGPFHKIVSALAISSW